MARSDPGFSHGTWNKPVLHFDRDILLSERFKSARPFGMPYKNPKPEFERANRRLATILQDDIVGVLEDRIADTGRPQKGSEALIRALLSSGNMDYDSKGFTVGIDEYLESTPAGPYFRNLEYGSRVFVGRIIHGFFEGPEGNKLDARAGAKDALRLVQTHNFINPKDTPAGRNPNPSNRAGFSPSSRTAGEFPVRGGRGSFAEDHALSAEANEDRPGNRRAVSGPIVIKNPIPAYHYFRDGVARFQRRIDDGLIREEYREAARIFVERGGLIIN